MKFSLKIFISTFLLVLLTLCIGETIVISITFNKELRNEIDKAKNENLMMRMEIATLTKNYNKSIYRNEAEVLDTVLETLTQNWKSENKQYQIMNQYKKVKKENNIYFDHVSIEEFPKNEGVLKYNIYKREDKYYLSMCTRLNLKEDIFIINTHDISEVFDDRNDLLQIAFIVNLCIGGIGAAINWIIVYKPSKPIREMTLATKKIREGSMGVKITTKNKDELGVLADCFNTMIESLEEKIMELEDAARRQEDFVGSFAHEIKTPLTSIIGYADLLRSKKMDVETSFMAANYIFSEGKRLENISIKLLELIVEKNTKLQKSKIMVDQLINEVVEILRPSLNEKNINVNLDMGHFLINVDVELMKTVLMNLIDNARKAVDENGIIRVRAYESDEKVVIEIIDNGRGIPKEDLDKITEAFYRVDKSRARIEGGAGLGLSISRQIIELHHGQITFDSELNKGTRVCISWRCKDESIC